DDLDRHDNPRPLPGRAGRYLCPVLALAVAPLGTLDSLSDAVAGASVLWLLAALALHLGGQYCRGIAWHGILSSPWPGLQRRRVCAWYMCGSGLSGVLPGRGGDAVRVGLARREVPTSSWPSLAGTLVAEGAFEVVSGIALTLAALWLGVGQIGLPSPLLIAAIAAGALALATLTLWFRRIRVILAEILRGTTVLREPSVMVSRVLPWQVLGRLLRLGAVAFFLAAFGLPITPATIVAAAAVAGSGSLIPLPGLGAAAAATGVIVALPAAAGHPLPLGAMTGFAVAEPLLMTVIGAATSLVLLSLLLKVRNPLRPIRLLRAAAPTAP
ncbi:MAG TPA: lysylphosphatidylglycerol synthase domain-containing protein, partial [Polyangia bacterium]|nr:lysylphosphatidylglycerol synthase domain-containing protein [Polyangia bacterium]